MRVGEIFVWDTDKAVGHAARRKYHVYIGEAGWRDDGHAFLFISSRDYGGDFLITQDNYSFLAKEESYISCNGLVVYPEVDIDSYGPVRVGVLRPEDALSLHSSLANSETMEGWQIRLCCEAIAKLIP